ncbi:MAG: NAD-dependent epimerase/dehydratase family protein, partial [Chloroflexi bacterium]|nr:NAD-dependent epimerase/dehydratase family protein [Chloroflexota bacterium]
MAQQGKVVAVTGASGYVGAKLLERLEQEPGLRKLVAFDVNPLVVPVHNIAVYRKDVSQPIDDELNDQGATTLVHLAFNARRGANGREVAAIREENLETLRSVMASCVRARVGHLIYLSSHTVYGAHSDNPVPIPDDAPMRPPPDFPYGYDKHLCELALEEFAQAQEDIKITVLRSCIVLGNGADSAVTQAFFHPWLLGVLDYNPALQFVYDDDLARVMSIIIQQEISGTFNVAGDGVV